MNISKLSFALFFTWNILLSLWTLETLFITYFGAMGLGIAMWRDGERDFLKYTALVITILASVVATIALIDWMLNL